MAAAGLIFLASKVSKYENKRRFWVRPALRKRKKSKVKYRFLPYSTLVLLTLYTLHIAKGPHCAESSLKVVKFATRQKPFDL
jgi:hypothetical protein